MLPLMDEVQRNPRVPAWLNALHSTVDQQWQAMAAQSASMSALLGQIEEALIELVPRGWAILNMPTDTVNSAVAMVKEDRGDDADHLLAAAWRGDTFRTKRVCDRVWSMGGADEAYADAFKERARLLRIARKHHNHGEFAASILLVQSQIEGIAADVTDNKKFFSSRKSTQADVVNPVELVSIEASLAALRSPYIAGVEVTQTAGSISRHGAAHGRELAYDTETVSAKTWSLLDAVVQWAMPLARAEAEKRKRERQLRSAGLDEVDERGRRVDDREFAETRDLLEYLARISVGWWSRHSAFRPDLIDAVLSGEDFLKRGLPTNHGVQLRVSEDGQCLSIWRTTASGWVLGIATSAKDGSFQEWLYSGRSTPLHFPVEEHSEWGLVWDTPPDWIKD